MQKVLHTGRVTLLGLTLSGRWAAGLLSLAVVVVAGVGVGAYAVFGTQGADIDATLFPEKCFQGVCVDESDLVAEDDAATADGGAPVDAVQYPLAFTDVTADAGIDFVHHNREERLEYGGGVAIFDFNGDDLPDIYASDSFGPNALYSNNGDGTFTNVAAAAGVADTDGRGNGSCAADYDNDGDQDLYVTNYGPSRLFSNNGDGTFTDITAAAEADNSTDTHRSTGCAWGDYDRDGLLDLIIVRHYHESTRGIFTLRDWHRAVRSLVLYHNEGDGTFENVTPLLGDDSGPKRGKFEVPVEPDPYPGDYKGPEDPGPVTGEFVGNVWGASFQPGWLDFDNDGDLDLYIVNDTGWEIQPNVLWRNEGAGTEGGWSFTDVSEESGTNVEMEGMGLAVGDYDLDGHLDMFLTNLGYNVLLRNSGDGLTFTDNAEPSGVELHKVGRNPRVAWGAVSFDYDNDMDEDLYVVSGWIKGTPRLNRIEEQPNVLLRNWGDGTFANVSNGSGSDDAGTGRGGVTLDFNNDGCLDLFVTNYGEPAILFENVCDAGNNWVAIRTVGTGSNRDGIGARITAEADGVTQIREVASGAGSMSQNWIVTHFGLGKAEVVETLSVKWPSGVVQTLTDVKANQRLTVTEPGTRGG